MVFCTVGNCNFSKTWRKIKNAQCSICGKLDGSKTEVKSELKEARSKSDKTRTVKTRSSTKRDIKKTKSASSRNSREPSGISQTVYRKSNSAEDKLVKKSRSSNARLDEIPAGIFQGHKTGKFIRNLENHRYNQMVLEASNGNYTGLEHIQQANKPVTGQPIRQNENSIISERRKEHLALVAEKRGN